MTSEGFERSSGTVCVWGTATPYTSDFLFDPDGDGWRLDRARFDSLLRRRARETGAELMLGARAVDCRHAGRHDWQLAVSDGRTTHQIRARWLIDAAGRAPWPGRALRRRTFDRLIAVFPAGCDVFVPQGCDRRPWIEATPCGWWCSTVSPSGRPVAVFYSDADLLRPRRRNDLRVRYAAELTNSRLTAARVSAAHIRGPIRAISCSSTLAARAGKEDWLAVGDAAATIDPISSHGLSRALEGGIEAANVIAAEKPAAAIDYADRITRQFGDYLAQRRYQYARESRFGHLEFWRRRAAPHAAVQARGF